MGDDLAALTAGKTEFANVFCEGQARIREIVTFTARSSSWFARLMGMVCNKEEEDGQEICHPQDLVHHG